MGLVYLMSLMCKSILGIVTSFKKACFVMVHVTSFKKACFVMVQVTSFKKACFVMVHVTSFKKACFVMVYMFFSRVSVSVTQIPTER